MCQSFPLSQEDKGRLCSQGGKQWRMQGRVPPFRIVDQTEAPKAEKIFLGDRPPLPPYLRVWMTAPPYLKAWIRHW